MHSPSVLPDFRLLFENAPGAALVLLADAPFYTIVAVSDAYLRMTMTTRELVIGRHFFDVLPQDRENPSADSVVEKVVAVRASLDRARLTGAADRMPEQKYDIRRPDGTSEERYCSALNTTVLDSAGVVQYLIHTLEDVTEQLLWRTFDTALSNTPDFHYLFDLEGRFTYVNRALLSLWQKSLAEALGKNFFDLDYPPELAERLQRQIQQVIDTKHPVRDQTPFTSLTGETGHYEYIFVPVFAEAGSVRAVAGSTREITELKRAEEAIEEDRRRWRELLLEAPAGIAGCMVRSTASNGQIPRIFGWLAVPGNPL